MKNWITREKSFGALKLRGACSLRSLVVMLGGAITAIACAWSGMNDHSVRFNDYRTGRGFYRLPPLPLMYNAKTGKEISTKQAKDYDFGDDREWTESNVNETPSTTIETDDVWNQAMAAVDSEKFADAKSLLEKFLTMTHYESVDEYEARQPRRNSAVDMLDAMTAIRGGSDSSSVKAYLIARRAYDDPASTEKGEPQQPLHSDKNLKDNWEFLHGANLYRNGEKDTAAEVFAQFPKSYPRSEKNEAAAYMAAKLTMESSFAFGNLKCGIEGTRRWRGPISPAEIESKDKCQDDAWRSGIERFQNFVRRYPSGRYVEDARGWLAYLYRRGGMRAEALAEYYRLLGHPTDLAVRLQAKKSLEMIGHEYNDETLDKVEPLIAGDVNASMAYAYHRIYNQAIDLTYLDRENIWRCPVGDDVDGEDVDKDKCLADTEKAGEHELERVARFASSLVKRHPEAHLSGGFLLRVAQADLELQNYEGALDFAKNALGSGVEGDLRAQALWVKGSAQHQRKEFGTARKTFEQLIAEDPKSKYVEGSKRLLAMVAEDRGDLESALEIYLDLNYETDVAYFVDVLIPTDRLAKFVDDHPNLPRYNRFLYGVATRYMREKRWNEARNILRRVQTEKGIDAYLESDNTATWHFSKEPVYNESEVSYVKTSWVMQDLKTIDIFEHYEQAVERAQGDEAKAEAMYQLASAFFEADDLAFYNPAAWSGVRAATLAQLLFSDHERFPAESQVIFEHLQMHDPWARSIPIYEEVVSRFPQSRVARDAMYSAAVAHERLSERISPWTAIYERGLFAGPRKISYADVKSTYPDYQLPRGTYGWKPSTRTVNGGPGWAARPKPVPRETREHKVKRILNEFAGYISTKVVTGVLPKIESKVDSGMDWYKSMIEAAIYGVLSAIGLSAIFLAGIEVHARRVARLGLAGAQEEPSDGNSRVDKIIE